MRIEQPTFPLSIAAFDAALRTGHGRVVQQLDGYGSRGLADSIVAACVSCFTYDPQCEASRGPWLVSIVDRAALDAEVMRTIEARVRDTALENHHDMNQHRAILKEFAAAGSTEARQLLYSALVRSSYSCDVFGAQEIVALDGMDGLLRVARQLGRWMQADPDFWADDWLIAQFDESTGMTGGFAALEREAEVDPDVASYLAGVRRVIASRNARTNRFDVTAYTGAEIVALVGKNPTEQLYWFRHWGARASSEQRETVFAALVTSDEAECVKRLFRCFAKVGVPRFDSRLLRWIADPDEEVRWAAVKALAPTKHFALRQAALRLIADGDVVNGITLLMNNFEADDFAFLTEGLRQLDDADEAHDLVGALMKLCEAHPTTKARDCLLYAYEFSPCSTCRTYAVRALIDTNTAPDWVLAESAFDADPATRALVAVGKSEDARFGGYV